MPPLPAAFDVPEVPVSASRDDMTACMPGADIGKLKFPTSIFTLQLRDKDSQWRSWAPIGANGLNVGRSSSSAHFPFLNSMAVRHLRLSYDGTRLMAEDLGSLNGVFLRLDGPVELKDGQRFRVGSQVLEFHRPPPFEPVPVTYSADGEEFLSCDVEPLAFLDLIRPNNERGLRYPLTKPDFTLIGREPRKVDLALPKADWVSGCHAEIRVEGSRFFLKDMGSRNGTFIQVMAPTRLKSGDELLVGRASLRVVDQQEM
jgi:pSer/pThr/pTyr-binding forkhead associated (FHA) protein